MYWFSDISVHTTYLGGLLGPSRVTGAGLGLLVVPLSLVTVAGVRDQDSGLASSLLSTAQQVGGATGLAVLGTVAWTVVANSLQSQTAHAARGGGRRAIGSRRDRRAGRGRDLSPGPDRGVSRGCWRHRGSHWVRCSSRR